MKIKKIFTIVTIIAISLSLTGCINQTGDKRSKQELLTALNVAELENDKLRTEQEEMQKIIQELNGNTTGFASMNKFSDGTIKSYNSFKGIITLPSELVLSTTEQSSNTAKVLLNTNISIVPSNKWLIKQNGTIIDYVHTSGISGYTKVLKTPRNALLNNNYEKEIESYITKIGGKLVQTNKLFLDNNAGGFYKDATITTEVPNGEEKITKQQTVRIGLFGLGDTVVQFMFIFDSNTTGDELVLSLLRTIEFGSQTLRIE